jgi:hypothetical protein
MIIGQGVFALDLLAMTALLDPHCFEKFRSTLF